MREHGPHGGFRRAAEVERQRGERRNLVLAKVVLVVGAENLHLSRHGNVQSAAHGQQMARPLVKRGEDSNRLREARHPFGEPPPLAPPVRALGRRAVVGNRAEALFRQRLGECGPSSHAPALSMRRTQVGEFA